jgi:GTPase SAR1 family protein
LDFWYDSIRKSTNDDIVIYLIGNKSDLDEDLDGRIVSKERAIDFCKKHHLQGFTECSAKDNVNIKDTFVTFYESK